MPLPAANTPWPPKPLADMLTKMSQWDAWYTGERQKLTQAYQAISAARLTSAPPHLAARTSGGLVGTVARWLWGTPPPQDQTDHRIHVPLAADIATASADLILAEEPTITVENSAAQDRLASVMHRGMSTLVHAAETAAAFGGTYLRASWDQDIDPTAGFLTMVDADMAWPEFAWGQLRAVTFWRVLERDNQIVRRHLERHELDSYGHGVICHALYEGTPDNLGHPIPLTEHTTTALIPVNGDGIITTLSPGLAVAYAPNLTPARSWRTHPIGRDLGRSDFDGVEPLFDAIDEAWTSWMRDLRLAKSRIIVPATYLDDQGPGQGALFDTDREVFTPLPGMAPGRVDDSKMQITLSQFAIRVTEHQNTVTELIKQALRSAGYAPGTLGQDETGRQMTATEIDSRDRRSNLTRTRKIRGLEPAIETICQKLLWVDQIVLGQRGFNPERPDVIFADNAETSPEQLARTVSLWQTAGAASIETMIRGLHPDWDETTVQTEVEIVKTERGLTTPDPFQLGSL